MAHSSRVSRLEKPRPDFPLFPHDPTNPNRSRWAKKIRGHLHYFGKVLPDDPQGEKALALWLDTKDDLLAGRKPRPKVDEGLTVESLVNAWLHAKRQRVDSGELAIRTWQGYKSLGLLIVESLGRSRAASDIGPDDFQGLRAVFAKRWGPGKLATAVTHTRSIWKWAYQAGLLATQQRFGEDFSKPSAKVQRQARNEKGPRMFSPVEVLAILDAADPTVKAMTLLGINGGIGNTDLAMLPVDALDLDGGWLTLPRCKTAIVRRIPLWNETVEAIRAVLAQRPEPKRGNEGLLFLAPNGSNYICGRYGTAVSKLFQRTATAAGVTGRTFYDARRTFATVADAAKDPAAVSAIMGHAPKSGDMSAIYRQRVDDARLRAVVDVVRRWLFGQDDGPDGKPGDGDRHDARKGTQQAQDGTAIQRAVIKCLQAIETASEADRRVLQSVWNASEIALALSGDTYTVQRFISTWGTGEDDDDQDRPAVDARPLLRVVG